MSTFDRRPKDRYVDRLAAVAFNKISLLAVGYEAAFIGELVRVHGAFSFQKWAIKMGALIDAMEAHFGKPDAHFIIGLTALWQGCDYCSRGHLLASNIMRYGETDELFPLRPEGIRDLQMLPDAEISAIVAQVLADDAWSEQLLLFHRVDFLRLHRNAEPEDESDRLILTALATWEWLTDCSITAYGLDTTPPLSSVAKDKALCQRYFDAVKEPEGTD